MAFAMTECIRSSFLFEGCGNRAIIARFDGGTISTDGGALLLRQTDQRLNLLARLAQCFLDKRDQSRVEHTILEMLSQPCTGWRWVTKTSTITRNCARISCSVFWAAGKTKAAIWRGRTR
jgi:hypothetical protein